MRRTNTMPDSTPPTHNASNANANDDGNNSSIDNKNAATHADTRRSGIATSDPALQASQTTESKTTGFGFPALAIVRILGAKRLNQISIYLIYAAIVAFVVFGTIASIKAFHDSQLLYQVFHYLPYALVGLSIPLTLYCAFILYRYRLSQPSMIALCIGVSSLLFLLSTYVALASWIGVAFLFKANFTRFSKYLAQDG